MVAAQLFRTVPLPPDPNRLDQTPAVPTSRGLFLTRSRISADAVRDAAGYGGYGVLMQALPHGSR